MIAKTDNPSFDTVVSEALEKMKDLTASSASYEVDRASGLWSVRRASKTSGTDFPSEIVAHLTGAKGA